MYNGILLSHKKNEMLQFTSTWVDLEIMLLTEGSPTEKDKCVISLICGT